MYPSFLRLNKPDSLPFLVYHVFQPPHHLAHPLLDLLQDVSVCPALRSPKQDMQLQIIRVQHSITVISSDNSLPEDLKNKYLNIQQS